MQTADLTGPDLAYWVARANMAGSQQERNIVRRHYGTSIHRAAGEPAMRAFVHAKLGDTLPPRADWQ